MIHIAVKSKAITVLRLLHLRATFDYDKQNAQGDGAIHTAVEEDSLDCLEFLLDKVDLRVQRKSLEGGTALHVAAELGNTRALEMILARLSSEGDEELVRSPDNAGREALVLTAIGGYSDCFTLLIKYVSQASSQLLQTKR